METVYHSKFGVGKLISEISGILTINFENLGEKKLNKNFAQLISKEKYEIEISTPKVVYVPKEPIRHEMKLMSSSHLVSVLKCEEDKMAKNMYFDLSEVCNSAIYTDGVDYYSNTKELIGDSWKLAMFFAK